MPNCTRTVQRRGHPISILAIELTRSHFSCPRREKGDLRPIILYAEAFIDDAWKMYANQQETVLQELTAARIYVLEGQRRDHNTLTEEIFSRLHTDHQIMGATQYRAISGFGSDGVLHGADLTHINSRLPIVIEFYDTAEVVQKALIWIRELVDSDKIVTWKLQVG